MRFLEALLALQRGQPPRAWSVRIDAGVHKGARTAVDKRHFSIGSATTDDIVIDDPDLSGDRIWIGRGTRGAVRVGFEGRGVLIVNSRRVAAGRWRDVRGVAQIDRGRTRLTIGRQAPSAQATPLKSQTVQQRLVTLAVLLGILTVGGLRLIGGPGLAAAPQRATDTTADAARDPQETPRARLQRRLAAMGFGDGVAIAQTGSGLVATGRLTGMDAATWRDARHQLQAQAGGLPFVDRVDASPPGEPAAATAIPPDAIAAVDIGHRQVISRSGDVFGIGSALPDGWRLIDVGEDAFVVDRGGERVTHRYADLTP